MATASEKFELLITKGRHLPHDHGVANNSTENTSDDNVSEDKLEKGISFFNRNFFSMFVSMLTGLLSLMYIDTIARVLDATNKSNSPALSFQRYLSTLSHTVQWYRDLPSLIKSTSRVRALHRGAAGLTAFTQYEMVVTQWAFVGPVLLWPGQLGVERRSQEDVEGLLYVMMMVGRQLGISDELNLCLGDRKHCTEYSRLVLEKVEIISFLKLILIIFISQIIKPSFNSPEASETSKKLSRDLLDGVNILNPFIFPPAFLLWSEDLFHERKNPDLYGLHIGDRFFYKTQQNFLGRVFHVGVVGDIIRALANNLMRLNIFIASEWKDYILTSLKEKKDTQKIGHLLGAAHASFIIPTMVMISFGKIVSCETRKFRSEICFSVILATVLVIFTTYI